jgi:hypothetical protein
VGNPSRLSTWKPVLSSIKAKLSTWKRKILTWLGGYVLSFLPLYYMSIFPMLKGIINAISYINHIFFLWNGISNSHAICKVAWHKIIKCKSFGGLDLGSLHHKNLALLFKWF